MFTTIDDLTAYACDTLGIDVTTDHVRKARLAFGNPLIDDLREDSSAFWREVWDVVTGEPWPFGERFGAGATLLSVDGLASGLEAHCATASVQFDGVIDWELSAPSKLIPEDVEDTWSGVTGSLAECEIARAAIAELVGAWERDPRHMRSSAIVGMSKAVDNACGGLFGRAWPFGTLDEVEDLVLHFIEQHEECAAAAAEAVHLGKLAVEAVRAGDEDEALAMLERALQQEMTYGDAPAWRPVRDWFAVVSQVRDDAREELEDIDSNLYAAGALTDEGAAVADILRVLVTFDADGDPVITAA